jgi:hypothetical protein
LARIIEFTVNHRINSDEEEFLKLNVAEMFCVMLNMFAHIHAIDKIHDPSMGTLWFPEWMCSLAMCMPYL